jgi:hypothetical protein
VDSSHDYNNPSKVAFRDAIFPGQKLYQPVDGKLLVVSKSQKRLMEPPANAWPNPSSRQKSTQTVFWDQHTQSTKKRVLGRNRLAKAKKEKVISLSLKEMYDSCGETTILGTLYGAMERRTD